MGHNKVIGGEPYRSGMRGREVDMRDCCLDKRHGFVLLEVLIAVMILAVGLTGVIRSFLVAIQARRQAQEYLMAAVLLDNKLTELLSYRYVDQDLEMEGQGIDLFDSYRYEVSVNPVEGKEQLRMVRVDVFWPGPHQERSLGASTYLFAREPTGEVKR